MVSGGGNGTRKIRKLFLKSVEAYDCYENKRSFSPDMVAIMLQLVWVEKCLLLVDFKLQAVKCFTVVQESLPK